MAAEKYIRTILGQEIDIRDYQKLYEEGAFDDAIPPQEGGSFLEFYWHDLKSGKNYYDDRYHKDLSNEGVRADQDTKRNYLDFSHGIDENGWLIKYYPPIFDTQGTIRNGRKRTKHLIGTSERWVPAARWTYEIPEVLENAQSNYELNIMDTGFDANIDRSYSEPAEFKDFKESGRKRVVLYAAEGKKFNTPANIDKWFLKRGVFNLFHKDTVDKLRKAIVNMSQEGNDFMFMLEPSEAEKWLLECELVTSRNIKTLKTQSVDAKEKVILYSPLDVNLLRTFSKHILPNASRGVKTLIALYTLGSDPGENIKEIKAFPKRLQEMTEQCITFIQHDLSGVKIDLPFISSMWEIVGAIPQRTTIEKHKELLPQHKLISIEDY